MVGGSAAKIALLFRLHHLGYINLFTHTFSDLLRRRSMPDPSVAAARLHGEVANARRFGYDTVRGRERLGAIFNVHEIATVRS